MKSPNVANILADPLSSNKMLPGIKKTDLKRSYNICNVLKLDINENELQSIITKNSKNLHLHASLYLKPLLKKK